MMYVRSNFGKNTADWLQLLPQLLACDLYLLGGLPLRGDIELEPVANVGYESYNAPKKLL